MDLPVILTLWVATCIRGSATSIVAVPHHRMQPQKPKPGSAGPAETRTPLRGRPRARWCYRCPPKSAALGTPPPGQPSHESAVFDGTLSRSDLR